MQREATGVPRGGGAPALARQPPFTRGLRHLKGKLAAAVASTFSVSNSWHIYTGFWSRAAGGAYMPPCHIYSASPSHTPKSCTRLCQQPQSRQVPPPAQKFRSAPAAAHARTHHRGARALHRGGGGADAVPCGGAAAALLAGGERGAAGTGGGAHAQSSNLRFCLYPGTYVRVWGQCQPESSGGGAAVARAAAPLRGAQSTCWSLTRCAAGRDRGPPGGRGAVHLLADERGP